MVVMIKRQLGRAPQKVHYSTQETEIAEEQQQEDAEEIPKEIRIIAQEVQIVRALASNDVNIRNRQVRKLRKWLQLRSRSSFAFSEEDFIRIWKGLYYNMWMSDKPLVQEELAEQLGQLLQCFDGDVEASVNFFGAFVRTMCQEWFGIDQWRIDKFLMLTRRMLRYMFRVLKDAGWTLENVQRFNAHMQQTVLAEDSPAIGLTMHFLDIFFEELAKVSEGNIGAEQVGAFVRPFVTYLGTQNDPKLVSHCRTRVFSHLLYQSELGREYSEKYSAWREMGFPTASINDLERAETDSLNEEDNADAEGDADEANAKQRHLDPRAGNVDVFMPELPLDAKYIIDDLELLIYKYEMKMKRRKMLKRQLEIFQTYQRGDFPLGVKTMPRFVLKSEKPLIQEKVSQLENMENEMFGTGRKLKQLNKRKRRKLLKSLNFDNADESNFDQIITKAIPKLLKERKKARAAAMSGWVEEEIDEEVVPAKKKKIENESNVAPIVLKRKTKSLENGVGKIKSVEVKQAVLEHKQIEATNAEPAKKIKKLEPTTPTHAEKKEKPATAKTAPSVEIPKESAKKSLKTETPSKATKPQSEWNTPLNEGEIEYFIPSRKLQLKKANTELVLNPLAKRPSTPQSTTAAKGAVAGTPKTPASVKRVKIALKHNTAQNPSEYIRQIKNSPNVPYDADKKPTKGLLKPNSMPSPINPFYKKKIGLRLLNDTL